jgi:putative glutamine transport system substrate-binding protein
MKNKIWLISGLMCITGIFFAQVDSLQVNYYENFPYAYKDGTTLKGIEIDIVAEYAAWLKQKKNINVKVNYTAYSEFGNFYNSVKNGNSKVIGLGSVTQNAEREKEVVFSPPYLENLAVLITDGSVPTIKSKDANGVSKILNGMTGIVVNKSNHVVYMNNIKKLYNQTPHEVADLLINTTEKQSTVIETISKDKKVFGYMDIVAYWAFVKANPTKFLKIHKVFTEAKEYLGFILPKKNEHEVYLNEFFESGFGFTSTKVYHQILEKYLGYEIIESVEIK